MSHSQLKVFLLILGLFPGLVNSRLTAEQNEKSSLQMLGSEHAHSLRLLPYRDVSVPLIGEHADGKKSNRVRGAFLTGDGRTLVLILSGAASAYATYDCIKHQFIAVKALPEGYLYGSVKYNSKIDHYGAANEDASVIALIASDTGVHRRGIMLVDRKLNFIREISINDKFPRKDYDLSGLLLSQDGKVLVTAHSKKSEKRHEARLHLATWNTTTGQQVRSTITDALVDDWHEGLRGMLFSPDNKSIITYHGDAGLNAFDVSSLKLKNRKGNAPVEWAAIDTEEENSLLTMPSLRKWSWPQLNVVDGKNWQSYYCISTSHFQKRTAFVWGRLDPSGVVTIMPNYDTFFNFEVNSNALLKNAFLTAGQKLVISQGAYRSSTDERKMKFIDATGIQPEMCLVLPDKEFLKNHKGIHSFKKSVKGDFLLKTMEGSLISIHGKTHKIQNLDARYPKGFAFDPTGEQMTILNNKDHKILPAPSSASETPQTDLSIKRHATHREGSSEAFRFDPQTKTFLFSGRAQALHPTLPFVAEDHYQNGIQIKKLGRDFPLSQFRRDHYNKHSEFMPDDQHLVVLDRNSSVQVWNWRDGILHAELKRDLGYNGLADHVDSSISPDGKYIAICWFSTLDILSLPDLNVAGRYYIASGISNGGKLTAVQWSEDSQTIFLGDSEGRLATYSLRRLLNTDPEQNGEAKTEVTTN